MSQQAFSFLCSPRAPEPPITFILLQRKSGLSRAPGKDTKHNPNISSTTQRPCYPFTAETTEAEKVKGRAQGHTAATGSCLQAPEFSAHTTTSRARGLRLSCEAFLSGVLSLWW